MDKITSINDIFEEYDNNYYSKPLNDIRSWIFDKLFNIYNYMVKSSDSNTIIGDSDSYSDSDSNSESDSDSDSNSNSESDSDSEKTKM